MISLYLSRILVLQGRVDDNVETITKRFRVFVESSLPVVNYYDSKGNVCKFYSMKTKEEVVENINYFLQLTFNKMMKYKTGL